MADTSSTNLDKMRSAIADIIQKALLSHPTMDTNFVYSKSKIILGTKRVQQQSKSLSSLSYLNSNV